MADTGTPARERTFWFTMARAASALLSHTIYPVRYYGTAYTDLDAPYIVVANHKHWLDPLLVGSRIKRYEVRFLGKKELVKTRLGEWLLAKLHMIVVDRHNSDLSAMRNCLKVIREGHVLGIFPEGTRCRDTTLKKMEAGCSMIALMSRVRLLPVLIDKPCRLFRPVHVIYGPPIDISDLVAEGVSAETAEKCSARIRESILALSDSGV